MTDPNPYPPVIFRSQGYNDILVVQCGTLSKEVEYLYDGRSHDQKEKEGDQSLADRELVIAFRRFTDVNVSSLGDVLVKFLVAIADLSW